MCLLRASPAMQLGISPSRPAARSARSSRIEAAIVHISIEHQNQMGKRPPPLVRLARAWSSGERRDDSPLVGLLLGRQRNRRASFLPPVVRERGAIAMCMQMGQTIDDATHPPTRQPTQTDTLAQRGGKGAAAFEPAWPFWGGAAVCWARQEEEQQLLAAKPPGGQRRTQAGRSAKPWRPTSGVRGHVMRLSMLAGAPLLPPVVGQTRRLMSMHAPSSC